MGVRSVAKWLTGVATAASLLVSGAAWADCDFSLEAGAAMVQGSLTLYSAAGSTGSEETGTGIGYGALVLDLPAGTTLSEFTEISTDYNTGDDAAGGGSPRFSLGVDEDNDGDIDGYVHIYIGTPPNFTDATNGAWANTGNFIGDTATRYDLTQFGGPFYGTYADAVALLGGSNVEEVLLVVDGGWSQPDLEQTIAFDNIRIISADDACVFADTDDDNVPDYEDECVPSDMRPLVDVNGAAPGTTTIVNSDLDGDGCTIQDEVNKIAMNARNHGQYVSAIAHLANELLAAGVITQAQAVEMKTAAAKSDIGKK